MSSSRAGTSTGTASFPCVCGSSYRTKASLQQHQRRYCRGPATQDTEDEGFPCELCERSFATRAGMRLHMRKAHRPEYEEEMNQEASRARTGWTEDEDNELARAEASFEGTTTELYEFLLERSGRSRDAIKKRRQLASYKNRVASFRQERERLIEEMEQQTPENNIAIQNSNDENREVSFGQERERLVEEMEQQIPENSIAVQNSSDDLLLALAEIPEEALDGEDLEFRSALASGNKEEAKRSLNLYCESITARYASRRAEDRNNRTSSRRMGLVRSLLDEHTSRRKKRAIEYRLDQYDYSHRKKDYADRLLDELPISANTTTPPRDELINTFNNTLGANSPEDTEPIASDPSRNTVEISTPISHIEITEAIKTSMSGSPGPDGITLNDVKRIPINKLVLLFNGMLICESTPDSLRMSRTIMIPKSDSERHLAKNWRPITISSILLRLCNKILAHRLSQVELCENQRGFTRIDGCFANYASIETLIKHHKEKIKPLCIIWLDLAKAFDCVSHQSVVRAMTRMQVDSRTINYVRDGYSGSTTTISCGDVIIPNLPIKRGVKQGDPLSPNLFNLVLDELLVELNTKFTGVKWGETKLTNLAFADDLALISRTPEDGRRMLNHSIQFFEKRGLKINAAKCRSLVLKTVPAKKKLATMREPLFAIEEEQIPTVSFEDEFKYLGQLFSADGISHCNSETFLRQLAAVRRAPLKPNQKLSIIKDHLLPRHIASLQRPNVSKKILQKMDRMLRAAVRGILHLNSHCAKSIFYAPLKAGGLGLFQFSTMIPIITISRWEKLRERSPTLKVAYELSEKWIRRYTSMIPESHDTKEKAKALQAQNLENSYSGNGMVQMGNHAACNNYIYNPPVYWSGEDYIRAIQLRYNLLPTMGIPSNPVNLRRCRAGCFKTESLSHVLQNCPLTHWQRIQRHNYVARRLMNAARRRGWTVQSEPHIRCQDGTLKKPDLLLTKGNILIIAEVGINWEGPIPLSTQYSNKLSIYSTQDFLDALRVRHPGKQINIMPLIIGARGAWCADNNLLLNTIGLTSSDVQDLITTTIRGSCITHKTFMRAVWRQRDNIQQNLRSG